MCASDGAKLPAYHVDTQTCPYCFSPPTMTRLVSAVAPDVITVVALLPAVDDAQVGRE